MYVVVFFFPYNKSWTALVLFSAKGSMKLWALVSISVNGSLKQCIRKSNFSEQFVNYIKLNTTFNGVLHLYLQ